MSPTRLRIVSPNGHLGFAPTRPGSFYESLRHQPDYLIADSGSCDIGPGPSAIEHVHQPARVAVPRSRTDAARRPRTRDPHAHRLGRRHRREPQRRPVRRDDPADRPGARSGGVSASGTSTPRWRRRIVADAITARDDRRRSRRAARTGHRGSHRTERIVAVAGAAPYISLLDAGADVIIGGRSSDCAVFAAPAIRAGFQRGAVLLHGQGPGVRLVLRRAVRRQGKRHGGDRRHPRRRHRDAP